MSAREARELVDDIDALFGVTSKQAIEESLVMYTDFGGRLEHLELLRKQDAGDVDALRERVSEIENAHGALVASVHSLDRRTISLLDALRERVTTLTRRIDSLSRECASVDAHHALAVQVKQLTELVQALDRRTISLKPEKPV